MKGTDINRMESAIAAYDEGQSAYGRFVISQSSLSLPSSCRREIWYSNRCPAGNDSPEEMR